MMTDENAVPAPEAEANALAVEEQAAPVEQQQEVEGEAAPTAQTGDTAAEVPDGVKRRFDELTRKRREAERRAERAERKLRERESQDIDSLDYEEQIAERTLIRANRDQLQNDRETVQELALEAYQARVEVATAKYSDYAQVVGNANLPISPVMAEAIMDSDVGPDVAYYLGKNPALAARIANLNPVSQVRELGKIEAMVSTPRQAAKPAAAPVNPVGARSSGGAKDPLKMSMAEYIAWRNGK